MTNGGSSNSERKEARTAQAGDERHLREECGVFGVYAPERRDVARLAYYGLYALQHRGQESAGMVVKQMLRLFRAAELTEIRGTLVYLVLDHRYLIP